jgi:hypothetical protein
VGRQGKGLHTAVEEKLVKRGQMVRNLRCKTDESFIFIFIFGGIGV